MFEVVNNSHNSHRPTCPLNLKSVLIHIWQIFSLWMSEDNTSSFKSLWVKISPWRLKLKLNKPWNLFSVQPLLYMWESTPLGVISDPQRRCGGVRVQKEGQSWSLQCRETLMKPDPFGVGCELWGGVEMGIKPMKLSGPPPDYVLSVWQRLWGWSCCRFCCSCTASCWHWSDVDSLFINGETQFAGMMSPVKEIQRCEWLMSWWEQC